MIIHEKDLSAFAVLAAADPGWAMWGSPAEERQSLLNRLLDAGIIESYPAYRLTDLGRSYAFDILQLEGAPS